MAHNVIAGTVTRRARSERRTPHWLRAVYAVVAGFVVIVALALIFTPASGTDTLPACEWEDGSGTPDAPCFWDADTRGNHTGRDVLHYNGQTFVEAK
ncbi:hypothetical protein [Streptomyces hydrogenans]|uniref:Uncharacterized protein n=1 Tax=Streptomyces hydrogenans TaxID=1873719 RepID=A0ABQ3PJM8_9ACTN|nr:hypothetical protein [Streptomyces hydrogenans]GHG09878.1 hypothetical protein GCM10018784_23150 [Streptomyces hydrogenans]GHI25233.1 hypothetical protein Shyd_66040 [Streptomyces hydrogenans]